MKKGFTLIELLVVVLIIGILAAIALPQYTKAVEKSRAAEMFLVLKSYRDAVDRMELAGAVPKDGETIADAMDIDLTGGTWTSANIYKTKNFNYSFYCDGEVCGVDVTRDRGSETLYELELQEVTNTNATTNYCYNNDNATGKNVCAMVPDLYSVEIVDGAR
ncbi:prepilin-type N-terminal cleavage/methylation domain-containing protein [Elusimicrobium simillimum]|uniref:type IV pilin protein n=1 Tax=Elusimicrobium simillimum TaxID=3143438 RepID=UPI003C6EE96D